MKFEIDTTSIWQAVGPFLLFAVFVVVGMVLFSFVLPQRIRPIVFPIIAIIVFAGFMIWMNTGFPKAFM